MFFASNNPVNNALARWTAKTLLSDWETYRFRGAMGHRMAAGLALTALPALIVGWKNDRTPQHSE
ncbi:MAG TPA: hypothetical protein VMU87_02655 [Stellaceae bacterium]|nr:hypothetical protein [Stellaceae bacterium]